MIKEERTSTLQDCMHVPGITQVYDRLQKVGICLSHRATIKLVDKFSLGFDEKVLKWKEEIEENMDTTVSN